MRTIYVNWMPNEAFKIAQPLPKFTDRPETGHEGFDAQGRCRRSYAAPSNLAVREWMPVLAAELPANPERIVDSFA